MTKRRSLESNTDKSATDSSSSISDDHEPLGANRDQTPQAQAPPLNASSLSARATQREGVPSK